jgi:DNA modification methylase
MTQPNRMPIVGCKPKDMVGIPWLVAFALRADSWYLRQDIIWSKPNAMPESVRDRCTKAHEYLFLLTKSSRYYFDAEAIMEDCASGPSDVKRMLESKERIGGKHKDLIDPLSKASSTTNIGQKRSVGGKLRAADGDEVRSAHGAAMGRGAGWRDDPTTARLIRNKRSVWQIATQPYPEAHFAAYPEGLVTPCVLAGSRAGDLVLDPFCGSGTTGAVALKLGRAFCGIELSEAYAKLAERRIGDVAPMFNQIETVTPVDSPPQSVLRSTAGGAST